MNNPSVIQEKLLGLSRRQKRLLQFSVDAVLIWCALWLALAVRLGVDYSESFVGSYIGLFVLLPIVSLPIYEKFGLYRAVVRHAGSDLLVTIFKGVTVATVFLSVAIYWLDIAPAIPRSFIFNYWWLSLLLVGGVRLIVRQYLLGEIYGNLKLPFSRPTNSLPKPKVAIYGAGAAGNQLVSALRLGRTMQPVAFIDDDESVVNRTIAGLFVYKPKHLQQMLIETGATEVLLAIPSASRGRRREILSGLEGCGVHVRSVPGIMDLASGRVQVDDIQEVDIADLLGREAVEPEPSLFKRCIEHQVVMVTGAGGSIGSELCRQIITQQPKVVILFEHSEFNLYAIHQELLRTVKRRGLALQVVPILGSIRNYRRLLEVMRAWGVNTVYHAAAYKHVPMVEHNIAEGVMNNVLGTVNAAQTAIRAGVENFVLISTDKAVRPTNVMGGTKRLAEMALQALSQEKSPVLFEEASGKPQANKTRFTMVRFGNVLGSSGSVIPLFREQIQRGGPITVTHPNITRYFMTIPEAAQLVIQAGSMGEGGDVFVLDMGQPVRIAELAEKMIGLSGLSVRDAKNPHGDIAIEFSGLRPGEKLYEELLIGDNVTETQHPMIMRASEDCLSWDDYRAMLEKLKLAVHQDDFAAVKQLLREHVAGYASETDIVDFVYQQRLINDDNVVEFPKVKLNTQHSSI